MKNTNLITGKIGTGKTTGLMFKEMNKSIEENENILIIDNKEEYYKTYGEILKNNGYKTYVINFKDTNKSNGFNPLLTPYRFYKNNNKDVAVRIIENFAKSLFYEDSSIDPFWTNSAANYLTGIILTLFKEGKEDEINLGSVQVMASHIDNYLDKFREYVNNLDLVSAEYIYLSSIINAPAETRGGIVSVLKSELTKYVSRENLLNLLCSNEIDLTKIEEKTAIFIIGNNEYNRLVNVVISEIINVNKKFTYMLDNFDSLNKILYLDDLLDNASSHGDKVYIVSRNIENITSKYGSLIIDKFEIQEEVAGTTNIEAIGNYTNYPTLNKQDNKYFNLTSILK